LQFRPGSSEFSRRVPSGARAQLEYFAEAQVAGIVVGARAPIILTSRAD